MRIPVTAKLATAGLFFLATLPVRSQWFDQGPVFVAVEENDTIVNRDRHYTQAFKFSYLHTDNSAPGWLKKCADAIPSWGFTPHAIKVGTQIGQSIYTPEDLNPAQVVTNDRPYAGWLYTGFIVQRRGLTAKDRPALESFQMDIGIVGPESLAEDAQSMAHLRSPNGWDNQLDTELGVALKYMRAWLFTPQREGPRCFDFVPHVGLSLGNIDTSFRLGATFRLGVNLPDDFGPQTVNSLATTEGGLSPNRNGRRWGFYVFGGVEGSVVAYNEFIDGNLFRDSHHVTREPLVAEVKGGVAVTSRHVELGVAILWRTEEFTKQDEPDIYGTLFLKVKL